MVSQVTSLSLPVQEVCEEYWPTAVGETLTAGKLIVRLVSEEKDEGVTVRKFEISKEQIYANIVSYACNGAS